MLLCAQRNATGNAHARITERHYCDKRSCCSLQLETSAEAPTVTRYATIPVKPHRGIHLKLAQNRDRSMELFWKRLGSLALAVHFHHKYRYKCPSVMGWGSVPTNRSLVLLFLALNTHSDSIDRLVGNKYRYFPYPAQTAPPLTKSHPSAAGGYSWRSPT